MNFKYEKFQGNMSAIKMEMNPWDTSIITAAILNYLIGSEMKFKIDTVYYDGGSASGERLNASNVDLVAQVLTTDSFLWFEIIYMK
jgi:hypothetical protein